MATLQLLPVTTINGTTFATAQLILTPSSPDKKPAKTILPKQEPMSPNKSDPSITPPDFLRIGQNKKSECAKRRIHFSKKALTHPRPQSVTRRNARERNRVKAVNQGFITLANHVPPHLRSKKMSKVDTLRAAILYIQDLQEALNGDQVPGDLCSELASSPAASSSSESLPSSPSYQISSPIYQTADLTCQTATYQTSQFNHYPTQQDYTVPSQYQQQLNFNTYQPQCSQYFDNYGKCTDSYHLDFTRPHSTDICPSPVSSYNSDPEQIEDEILEFASWFQ